MAQKSSHTWDRVYQVVKTIPAGRVVTYGHLARMACLRGGAREAGHAMAACPNGRGIPWHRVVGEKGRLLIRQPLAALQRRLLQADGATFDGPRVDMSACGWKSSRTTRRRAVKRKTRRI